MRCEVRGEKYGVRGVNLYCEDELYFTIVH